jgi:competence protein ComEA
VGVINVNEATEKQLSLLPGVGPSKAQAIVSYRSKRSFKDPRHLIRVRGIGRTTLKKILPFLTVKGPTTLKKK